MVTIRNIKNGRVLRKLSKEKADFILKANKQWAIMPIEDVLDIVKTVMSSEQNETKTIENVIKSKKNKVNNETADTTTV